MIQDLDRSTPIRVPPDRPLTYQEQRKLWTDGQIVPEMLRLGPVLERRQFSSDSEFRQACERERAVEAGVLDRYGWLLNRLEWDAEFPQAHLDAYEVPSCCQPGARRVSRKALAKLRWSMYPSPKFSGALGFRPPYDQGIDA